MFCVARYNDAARVGPYSTSGVQQFNACVLQMHSMFFQIVPFVVVEFVRPIRTACKQPVLILVEFRRWSFRPSVDNDRALWKTG